MSTTRESKPTIRAAVVSRIQNSRSDDNVGLGLFFVFILGVIPFAVTIAICITVYYSLKLFVR